jgi:hypothetical protein
MLTAEEQLFLEITNRIRLDPQAAARDWLAGDLNAGVAAYNAAQGTNHDFSALVSLPVLAPNEALTEAARLHSDWMLQEDTLSHAGDPALRGHPDYPLGPSYAAYSSAGERMAAAGYEFTGGWAWAENLAMAGSTGRIDPAEAIESHVRGLFESVGHRANTLDGALRETGVGQALGGFEDDGTVFDASLVTQKFARSGDGLFVTGVILDDADGDGEYDVGEGVGGLQVTVGGATVTSGAAGGYVAAVPQSGTVEVVFAAPGGPVTVSTTLAGENVKLDLVDGRVVQASGDLTLLEGATDARILGAAGATLTGNAADNRLQGGPGDDMIDAGAGADTIVFRAPRAQYEIVEEGDIVTVTHVGEGAAGDGTDRVTGAEALEFADMTVALAPPADPGEGEGDPGGAFELTGHVRLPGGAPLGGVAIRMTLPDGETGSTTTAPDGSFAMSHDGGAVALTTVPGADPPAPGITASDALQVLRMAIGIDPDGGAADAFDFIAADVDRNGRVEVVDAVEVLRHVIGQPAEGAGDYVLIDGDPGPQSRDAVVYDAVVDAVLDGDTSLDLAAVPLGDVGIGDLPA